MRAEDRGAAAYGSIRIGSRRHRRPHRHELHGAVAHAAWLGVHATLMTGARNRVEGFLDCGWDSFSRTRGQQVLDRSDAARIDWDEDRTLARSA